MKQFFQKKKKFLIVLGYFIFLLLVNVYVRGKYDDIQHRTSSLIVYGKEDHSELFNQTKGVTGYSRLLSFYAGEDNDVIYMPKTIIDANGLKSYAEEIDKTKLRWDNLEVYENKIILAAKATDCNVKLTKDEVVIELFDFLYDSQYLPNFINNEAIFKYNDELIPLKIKKIVNPSLYPYICISDELYDELEKEEQNYIFDVQTDNYKTYEKLKNDWEKLEDNNFFLVTATQMNSTIEISNKISTLGDLVEFIQLLNVISVGVLIILIIVFIINLLQSKFNKDEESKE